MEVKRNMNSTQRKMLDEIYTKQFKSRRAIIIDERTVGLRKVEEKVLKEIAKNKDVKAYLEAGKKFYELAKKLKPMFQENGIGVNEYISSAPSLKVSYGYSNDYQQAQEVVDYRAETARIENVLSDKESEMRAKIWGVDLSYAEVEAEIKELLKAI